MLEVRWPGVDVRMRETDREESRDRIDAGELHSLYLKDVFRYVSRRVPRQEADDITMQVFTAALEALPRFRGECPPRVWLLRIAHGKVVDALRRRSTRRETLASEMTARESDTDPLAESPAATAEGPEAALERAETRRMIRSLVDQLSQDQREALLLQYVEELSVAEIAVTMGRSSAAVDSLLQRARAALFRLGKPYFLGDDREHQP
jgi:RNA polymerase sigma-70 factor (ECF subfamily)